MLTVKILDLIKIKRVPFALGLFALFLTSRFWTVQAGTESILSLPVGFRQVTVGEYFACAVPLEWVEDSYPLGLSAEEKKVYGITLHGPWRGEIPVKISIQYYATGNLLYSSVDHYIRVFSKPALGVALEGNSYGPVTSTNLSGRSAKVFERLKNEYLPIRNQLNPFNEPDSKGARIYETKEMMAKPVPVKERFVVLPSKSGFYALHYSSHAESFQEFLAIFEKVTASFIAKK